VRAYRTDPPLSVGTTATEPTGFRLAQNYPNPFNAQTTISYEVGGRQQIDLSIVDLLGRRLETLVSGMVEPGSYTVQWDADRHASGVYLVRLEGEKGGVTKRMVFLK
jgi:hypothetical protein